MVEELGSVPIGRKILTTTSVTAGIAGTSKSPITTAVRSFMSSALVGASASRRRIVYHLLHLDTPEQLLRGEIRAQAS
jgi:hypothetical protein